MVILLSLLFLVSDYLTPKTTIEVVTTLAARTTTKEVMSTLNGECNDEVLLQVDVICVQCLSI